MRLILLYTLTINAVALACMLLDKLWAKKNMRRIPERRLMLMAALGGSPGILFGMYLARHKTRHLKFTLGVPVILTVQIVALILLQFSLA